MIDTEALRKKVIDLAIQGKLTQQLPEDGNAEDLYVQIQEEKAKLIKDGKIKKEKTLTEISDDEIPFEIPNNWRWVRIGDATYNHGQRTPDKRFCYIDVGTLDNVNHKLNDNENIIEAKDAPSRAKKIVKYDDVLYSTVRPYLHNICIVDKDFSCEPIASTAFAVMHTFDNCLLSRFLYYWLLSEWFDKYANGDSSKGTLYPAIGEKDFFMGLVPLAPFEEQKRIVKIIDEIFAQIDLINDLQQQYESDREILKGKIINAGIQGKLTEQLSGDDDAEDLYLQIQEEKAKLIKEGKIKKEKSLPEISVDEIPFEIPLNWKWVRWGDISERIQYGYNAPAIEIGRIKMVRISDIQDGKVNWDSVPYCDITEESISEYLLHKNDILFARTGGTVGKSYLVSEVPEDSIYAGYLIRTSYSSLICAQYMKFFMDSELYWKQLQSGTIATAQPNCNGKTLSKMIVPLPPLAEQRLIAERIKELFRLLAL